MIASENTIQPMPGRCLFPSAQPAGVIDPEALLAWRGIRDLPLARRWMCRKLESKGIPENVLVAFQVVPRHVFAPTNRWRVSYLDLDLWTGVTWMTSPSTVARVVSAIRFKPPPRIYEVGTGTAYQATILAAMGATVLTVDIHPECSLQARLLFKSLAIPSVAVGLRDGVRFPPSGETFDAIVVNCALPRFPENLAQLVRPGGVIIAPVARADGSQRLMRYSIVAREPCSWINLGMCRFAPAMIGSLGEWYGS